MKKRCEELYKQIKDAQNELKKIREECTHETYESLWSWRVGSEYPATICRNCGELIKMHWVKPEKI